MSMPSRRYALVCSFTLLSAGFAAAAFADDCVGAIVTPPEGMVAASDEALLAAAIGEPGKGALCKGQVFVAEKPVTVYRV